MAKGKTVRAYHPVESGYEELKREVKNGHFTPDMLKLLGYLYQESLTYLNGFPRIQLNSNVPGKRYIAYQGNGSISRAINEELYQPSYPDWETFRNLLQPGADLTGHIDPTAITRILYCMAISFCAAIGLLKEKDQQTPGTYFQHFIATFFSWRVGVEPESFIKVQDLDQGSTVLPTDFVFNLGKNKRKFHMPIKTSSRERAVMLWAHQRLLDGVFGIEQFMGTPVLLAETKKNSKTGLVDEICLPEQWKLYQLYIARLKRIYYLDLPKPYEKLNEKFPPLIVKPFGDFFFEWDAITP